MEGWRLWRRGLNGNLTWNLNRSPLKRINFRVSFPECKGAGFRMQASGLQVSPVTPTPKNSLMHALGTGGLQV